MAPNQASAVILAAFEGVTLTGEEKACFQSLPPAGFTLFRRNMADNYPSIRQLTAELQPSGKALPLMIAIDQEGGRVARLRSPFPNAGPAMNLAAGARDQAALQEIYNYAYIVGTSLLGLGINVNFAPVLDILTCEENVAIGDRCFGRDALSVQERAGAFLRGMQATGVLGCLKHFPGQGDANHDTHESGTRIEASRSLLEERELSPFVALLAESPMVMISHALYPALDPDRPASLSPAIMQGLLREKLGFDGLIVSDDMNMKAIDQSQKPWCEALIAALVAGVDLLLVCRELERYRWAVEALSREAQKSPAFAARLANAAERVARLRTRFRH